MPTYNRYTDTNAIQKYQFLHHFLPHPETKSRAKLLQHPALFTYLLVIVFFWGLLRVIPQVAPGVLGYASDITTKDLLTDTNKVRNEHGLNSLTINSELSKAAEQKATHMFKNNYWAHIAPDGTTPWDFILGVDYDYSYAGENLAKNFSHSSDVVQAWYDSPSHRENLLSPNYTEIGFAVVNGVLEGYETTLVVQMFGKPRQPAQVAAVYEEEAIAPATVPASEPIVVEEKVVPLGKPVELEPAPKAIPEENSILPPIDILIASKSIAITVGVFLITMFGLDIWYTKKKAIPKISGNAIAHMLFLVIMFVGVWFAISPGKIL